jgi:hypothetical protein
MEEVVVEVVLEVEVIQTLDRGIFRRGRDLYGKFLYAFAFGPNNGVYSYGMVPISVPTAYTQIIAESVLHG